MIEEIEEKAQQILAQSPGAVVAFRLLRDVLRLPPDDSQLRAARKKLDGSIHVQALADEQWEDGSWGAFHSRSTKRKQKIPSTEVGVERALALGLDAAHPVPAKAAQYILNVMEGRIAFPDTHEKNDRWPTGMRLFLASTLSLIQPDHAILAADRKLWQAIAQKTFQSGQYSAEDESAAHTELTGATVKGSYLVLNSRYQLNILGSKTGTVSKELETALLYWLWQRPDGIGYLDIPLSSPPPSKPGQIDRWLASLELLARSFPAWVQFAPDAIEWIWEQQNAQGFWDFGSRPNSVANLPLSDSWRRKENRIFDWTTRVLVLLRKYADLKYF